MDPQRCPDLTLLAATSDGVLSEAAREEILGHLDACPGCLSRVSAAAAGASWMEGGAKRRGTWARASAVAAALVVAGSSLAGWVATRRGETIDPILEGHMKETDSGADDPRIAGDTAVPPRGGTLAFRDGTRAIVDPGSILRVGTPGEGERLQLVLDTGNVRMEVASAPGRVRIRTPLGDVTVLGTRFSVRLAQGFGEPADAPPRYLGVAVENGRVAVRARGREVILSAGHRAHLLSGGAPVRQAGETGDGGTRRIADRLEEALKRGDSDGATLAQEMLRLQGDAGIEEAAGRALSEAAAGNPMAPTWLPVLRALDPERADRTMELLRTGEEGR